MFNQLKKPLFQISALIIIGFIIASFWIYNKYLSAGKEDNLVYVVQKKEIQEVVKVRGEVVPQKDLELQFPFSGTVSRVIGREGAIILKGAPIISLDSRDDELELEKLNAQEKEYESNLEKLQAGKTPQELAVYGTKVTNASTSLDDARNVLIDKIKDSYTKADDAIRSKVDPIFTSPRGTSPQLVFVGTDAASENYLESNRSKIEDILIAWQSTTRQLNPEDNLNITLDVSRTNLDKIKDFLEQASFAVNGLTPNAITSQTSITTWKTDISTARTNVNTAITNLLTAQEKVKTAESALSLAKVELNNELSGTRQEDLSIAQAKLEQVQSQASIFREKIRKSTIYAPVTGVIEKILLEEGETFNLGQAVVSMTAQGYKIQADISELEIGKIKKVDDNKVEARLDAFLDEVFQGKVVSIDAKQIKKDDDVYYRTNIIIDGNDKLIRLGMSADLTIYVSNKKLVLVIPDFLIYKKDGENFVTVVDSKKNTVEMKVKTGISDGENVEIIEGLYEGQNVVAVSGN